MQMNLAIKKINQLEVVTKVEAKVNTWVDELDEDIFWKFTNNLVGIMG